jgi:uncharacterized protein (DUF305 family)
MHDLKIRRSLTTMALAATLAATAVVAPTLAQETATPDRWSSPTAGGTPVNANICSALDATPIAGSPIASPMGGQMVEDAFDLRFIDMMVMHHGGAILMSQVALDRAESEDVRMLAQDVIDKQQPEIDELLNWRTQWYPDAPAMQHDQMDMVWQEWSGWHGGMMGGSPMAGQGHMGGSPMAGQGHMGGSPMAGDMGTPGAMRGWSDMNDTHAMLDELCNAPAGEFDRTYVRLMIEHHEMAIMMAEVALERAENQELRDAAQRMIDDQRAELDTLRGLQMDGSGTPTGGADATPTP